MIAEERIYWSRDGKQIFPEGHAESAFLLVAAGTVIPDDLVKEFSIKNGCISKIGRAARAKAIAKIRAANRAKARAKARYEIKAGARALKRERAARAKRKP